MYIVYICFLAPLLVNGFSLIEEEADLNSLSSYETNDDNADDVGVVDFENISKTKLEEICRNSNSSVYISEEDVTIDCRTFNMAELPVEASQGRIKREVVDENKEEPPVEGSGSPPEKYETSTPFGEDSTTSGGADEQSQTKEAAVPVDEVQAVTTAKTEVTTEKPEEPQTEKAAEPTTQEATTKKAEEPETEAPAANENEDEAKEQNNEDVKQETEKPPSSGDETDHANQTQESKDKEPSSSDGSDKIEQDEDHPKKQVEVIKGGKSLISHTHANESIDPEQAVKTDGSTQETKTAGSKDTTILIVLFAAVVVVGAMAFGYNFIKKRKQRSAGSADLERGVTVKTSLQNLAKPDSEREKQPLMEGKEVEMVNMKKTTSTEEIPENGTNDLSVKS